MPFLQKAAGYVGCGVLALAVMRLLELVDDEGDALVLLAMFSVAVGLLAWNARGERQRRGRARTGR